MWSVFEVRQCFRKPWTHRFGFCGCFVCWLSIVKVVVMWRASTVSYPLNHASFPAFSLSSTLTSRSSAILLLKRWFFHQNEALYLPVIFHYFLSWFDENSQRSTSSKLLHKIPLLLWMYFPYFPMFSSWLHPYAVRCSVFARYLAPYFRWLLSPHELRSFLPPRDGCLCSLVCVAFFFLRDDTNLLRKTHAYGSGEKFASKQHEQTASKTPLHAAHTQPTPTLRTPHTPRHPHTKHSLQKQRLRTHARVTKSSKHYSHSYVHTGCIAKQANFFNKHKCKHKSDCQMIAKQSDCSKKDNVSFVEATSLGHHLPAQIRGSQISPSLNHMSVASIIIPPACEKQRKARDFVRRKKIFTWQTKYRSKTVETKFCFLPNTAPPMWRRAP